MRFRSCRRCPRTRAWSPCWTASPQRSPGSGVSLLQSCFPSFPFLLPLFSYSFPPFPFLFFFLLSIVSFFRFLSLSFFCSVTYAYASSPTALHCRSVCGHRTEGLGVTKFGQTGSIPDLYHAYGIDSDAIKAKCLRMAGQ